MFCRIQYYSYLYRVDNNLKLIKMEKAKLSTDKLADYQRTKFEDLGFFTEFLIDNKLIGTKNHPTNPLGLVGYASTKENIAEQDILFKNKKIKKGMTYITRVYPLCGKVVKK